MALTHDEIEKLAGDIQTKCNEEIAKRSPGWSRYVRRRMLDALMKELAPDWDWFMIETISGAISIILSRYKGPVAGLEDA